MKVGVHEAVLEDHLEDRLASSGGQPAAGLAIRHALGARGLVAVDELHGQHALGAEVVVEIRHPYALHAGEVLAEAAVVGGLEPEVELGAERVAEARGGAGQREHADGGDDVEHPRPEREDGQVALDLTARFGALHLDGHALAGVEAPLVHLGDAGGRDGLALDVLDPRAGGAEVFFEHALHGIEGGRRDGVLQARERLDVTRPEQVRSAAEDLPEFHERGAESLQGLGQHLPPQSFASDRVQASAAHAPPEVAGQHREEDGRDPEEAGEEPERGHRRARALWSADSFQESRKPGARGGSAAVRADGAMPEHRRGGAGRGWARVPPRIFGEFE